MEGLTPWNLIECMNCSNHSLMMYDIVYPREVYFMIGNPVRKIMNTTKLKFEMEEQISSKVCK